MRNVKFWTYTNGAPVKLKMQPGQTLSWRGAWATDEGWSSEAERYHYDGARVTCESVTDGRDCDGRLTRHSEAFFDAADAAAGNTVEGVTYPKWQHGASSQRDYAAEAAGY